MSDGGFINFRKEDLQSDEGIAQLNRILNLLAINLPGDSENVKIYSGYGTPEAVVTAGIGSIYMRVDGSSDTSVYVKESGTGNTGWVANSNVALPLAVASGGTGGNFSAQVQGVIPYFSGTGVISGLATGTAGKFLRTNGASADPSWETVAQSLILRSTTTWSGATTSGDIVIEEDKNYKLILEIKTTIGGTATLTMLVNGETSAEYAFANRKWTFANPPVGSLNGHNATTQFDLMAIGQNQLFLAEYFLSTSNKATTKIFYINGTGIVQAGNVDSVHQFSGFKTGNTAATSSFVINSDIATSGTAYLYEIAKT